MSLRGKSIFIGSLSFICFALLRYFIPLRNMGFFVAACIVFVLAAVLFYIISGRRKEGYSDKAERIWCVLPVVALTVWLILFYINETNTAEALDAAELIRRTFPFPLWITLMLAGTAVCLFLLKKSSTEKVYGRNKIVRVVITGLFTIGTSVQFYAPNIFQDVQGGTYHSHAYTNSIINACWLIPYSHHMESLYGHYAILYMPVLKVLHRFFHVDYLTGIWIVTAAIAAVSILLFAYILNYFAKSNVIYYLALFAIGEEYFMLMQGGVYMQVHPHRMIFPVAVAALALLEHRKQKRYPVLSVILLTLSFVWSTEVGMVTMLAYTAYSWAWYAMDGEKFSVRKAGLLLREAVIYVLLPFALAYSVINGYNLLAGGSILNFEEFMFPLISDRGYIDSIELSLPDVTHAWTGAAVLFLGITVMSLLYLLLPEKGQEKGEKPYYFLLGVMCLGLMLYYINRPVEGCMFIVMFLMLIIQAIILQKSQQVYSEWKDSKEALFARPQRFVFLSLRIITTFILFIMAFDSLYSMPSAWKKSAETIWKRDELAEFAEHIWIQIPPDAKSFGEGVPELMALIDRDTHLHTTEWSYRNTPLDTMEMVRKDLEDEEWFFCSTASLYYMQCEFPGLTDHFYVHEEFEYNGAQFAFFRRIEE